MKKVALLMIALFCCVLVYSQTSPQRINPQFVVEDDSTAIKIAEAIWVPKIGSDVYNKKKPYKAILIDDSIWVVHGTIGTKKGGSPTTYIQKRDGKVVSMIQTK